MFNHILIPLDGSSLAERALPHAVSLAQALEAPITLLRVIEDPQTDGHIESADRYRIRVENPDGVNRGVRQPTLDSKTVHERMIPLAEDSREHQVYVRMG